MSSAAPKKYVKINGVMKLNPEFKRWQEAQTGVGTATSLPNSAQALPVVSSMEDHMQLNNDLGTNIPLAESTDATIEMMQEPEFCVDAGMNPDTMVDEIGAVLSKYEVPMGLMNKVSHVHECNFIELSRILSLKYSVASHTLIDSLIKPAHDVVGIPFPRIHHR